jgi:HD-GYP domain-containing protein (c-di-GMP phosphodiesterase class II)
VAYYSVMLAENLGITNREELNRIATGGLLHDLGKLEIPEAILTKDSGLTDQEFAIIKRHPTVGFRKLCQRTDLQFGQLMMVYQHHERLDGRGYPVGVGGDEIHEWARICAVVDVFEALTSNRPYRAGMTSQAAFQIMDRSSPTGFDASIYQCWKAIISAS